MNKTTSVSKITPAQTLTAHHEIGAMTISSDGRIITALQETPSSAGYVPIVWNRQKIPLLPQQAWQVLKVNPQLLSIDVWRYGLLMNLY